MPQVRLLWLPASGDFIRQLDVLKLLNWTISYRRDSNIVLHDFLGDKKSRTIILVTIFPYTRTLCFGLYRTATILSSERNTPVSWASMCPSTNSACALNRYKQRFFPHFSYDCVTIDGLCKIRTLNVKLINPNELATILSVGIEFVFNKFAFDYD